MLKFNPKFMYMMENLTEDDYDEVINVVEEHLTDDYTRGYMMGRIEGDWGEIGYDELVEEIIDFAQDYIKRQSLMG